VTPHTDANGVAHQKSGQFTVPSIKQIIDGKDTFAGRAFDFTVQVLIVV
jgi:hypothetical protein